MKADHPRPADGAEEAAIAWFVRLRDEEATGADRKAFAAWLASDHSHREAWNEIDRLWSGLSRIAHTDITVAPPPAATLSAATPSRRSRRWMGVAAAAALLAAVVVGWRIAPEGLLADHRTGTAERRMVTLPDGSQVELGPGSALDIAFEAGRRRVRLIAGQAHFSVARDGLGPFVVEAGQGRTEVLGTAFDVKMLGDGTVAVAVTHNAVSVSAASGAAVRLAEGQAVSYGSDGLSTVRQADLDAVLGWREDRLVFHDAPLDAVLAEIGRYRRGHVQLLGAGLGARRVTAVFDARQPEAALDTIARSLDLRLLRATGLLIALSAR